MVSRGSTMTSQSACSWEKTHSFLKTAMGLRLLCGVALCFLALGESWELVAEVSWKPCPIFSRTCLQDFSLITLPIGLSFHLLYPLTGLGDKEVIQTPRFLTKRTGEKVVLECSQDMGHERMFWYRQDPGLGLRLIYFSYDANNNDKGDIPEGYSVSREKREKFSLILESASVTQTSLYLCASSSSTVVHSHSLPAQKRK